jgi:hypothetical protein
MITQHKLLPHTYRHWAGSAPQLICRNYDPFIYNLFNNAVYTEWQDY